MNSPSGTCQINACVCWVSPSFFLNLPGGYLSADWNSLNIKWRARSWETPRFFPFLSRIAHGHGSFKMHTGWWHHRGACQVQALEPAIGGKWVLSHGQFLVPFCLPQPCNDQPVCFENPGFTLLLQLSQCPILNVVTLLSHFVPFCSRSSCSSSLLFQPCHPWAQEWYVKAPHRCTVFSRKWVWSIALLYSLTHIQTW